MPLAVLLLISCFGIYAYLYAKDSALTVVDFHNGEYSGAQECQECHQENYDSWHQTYHRTMTQEANEETVAGRFDGSEVTYWGTTIRPVRKNKKYYFEYYNPETQQLIKTLEVKRTVGSRRYQQYLATKEGTQGNYYRLEILWHIEDKRWVHLNGAFLGNDNQTFDSHNAIWNQNCIFCHNTGIKPNMTNYDNIVAKTKAGKPLNLKVDSRFDSHVSDLGIGCESCHANGQDHIDLNQNPIRKYYLHYSDDDDKSIINPGKLSAKRSMDVCGQCHGQRTPKTYELARTWMEDGPTYRPGDDLQSHVNPVWKESYLSAAKSNLFEQRFWHDGTPRLSAYEYQGVLQSKCHVKADLTCNDCHSMHGGDPKGMITEEKRSNSACLSCHQNLSDNITQHTGHSENSEGSLCYNCHMPKIVYGVMTFHRSHRIESPNPVQEFNNNKPNACVSCHLDKKPNWIIESTKNIWPEYSQTQSHSQNDTIQIIYQLHSGDPVERSIAAHDIFLHHDTIKNNNKIFLIPHLLFAMEDTYPAIRRFSFKALNSILDSLSIESQAFVPMKKASKNFDFIAELNKRSEILIQTWIAFNQIDRSQWPQPPQGSLLSSNYQLNIEQLIALRELAMSESKQIEIGE